MTSNQPDNKITLDRRHNHKIHSSNQKQQLRVSKSEYFKITLIISRLSVYVCLKSDRSIFTMDQNEQNINDSRVDIARLQEELSSVKAELTSEQEKNENDKKYTEQLVEAIKDLVETNKKLKGNNQLHGNTRSVSHFQTNHCT